MKWSAVMLAIGLSLAGCQEAAKPATGSADGEILPASVSDAMLPLDTVRSQAPLAPKAAITETGGAEPKTSTPTSRRERPVPSAAPESAEPIAADDAAEPE